MAITTRSGKGTPLTQSELDTNFTDLRDGIDARTPAAAEATGIKIGDFGSDVFGWHDLKGELIVDAQEPNPAVFTPFLGGIRAFQFADNTFAQVTFHIPHDYKMGSDIFMHFHWAHASSVVTGGSVTWAAEVTYSKGHDQAAFSTPVTFTVNQNASTSQYQHMIAEAALSVSGGSGTQLDTTLIEPDGLLLARVSLDSNNITTSNASTVNPFAFFVDLHYQSTNVATKNKSPNFWA